MYLEIPTKNKELWTDTTFIYPVEKHVSIVLGRGADSKRAVLNGQDIKRLIKFLDEAMRRMESGW